jgi:hypothetical protein
MDYVLPDMMGIDICSALARNDAHQADPAARHPPPRAPRSWRSSAPIPPSRGFVPKPFKPAEIKAAVIEALRVRAKPEPEPVAPKAARLEAPKHALAEMEKIARALFGVLAPSLTKFPEWLGEMGADVPSASSDASC